MKMSHSLRASVFNTGFHSSRGRSMPKPNVHLFMGKYISLIHICGFQLLWDGQSLLPCCQSSLHRLPEVTEISASLSCQKGTGGFTHLRAAHFLIQTDTVVSHPDFPSGLFLMFSSAKDVGLLQRETPLGKFRNQAKFFLFWEWLGGFPGQPSYSETGQTETETFGKLNQPLQFSEGRSNVPQPYQPHFLFCFWTCMNVTFYYVRILWKMHITMWASVSGVLGLRDYSGDTGCWACKYNCMSGIILIVNDVSKGRVIDSWLH